ncbi:HAD hydrolase-like protein [Intestinibacillus sp. NTUH-41-i26]|uniref:HAD hydrolase-like protein n=1 Tax=Intestinibacillus sp. NTUH-41-i26 TaxID=3079303 RepID=UPI002934B6C5|nr:HAD hydrolase-like protein [Intestinibacillus sp. NTUH-41-i26]WOC76700.1 HAD hydrolase-like protein [Intestinibacillus sp. NTUH-41-i26]
MNCFVFDIDGTLIDTAAVDQQSFQQALREFGYHYSLEELRFFVRHAGTKVPGKAGYPGGKDRAGHGALGDAVARPPA